MRNRSRRGCTSSLLGLFKKLLIADQLDALFVGPVFADPAAFDPAAQRWALRRLGGADLLRLLRLLGHGRRAAPSGSGSSCRANFHFPYLATSITDFWRRWHLSLSTWLRDYVYFPLGGSRGGPARTYANLFAVFLLCGLWHGATWAWLAYGAYNGALMCLHRAYDRAVAGVPWADAVRSTWAWRLAAWCGTMALVVAGLILIRMPNWSAGAVLFRSLLAADLWPAWSAAVPVWVPPLVALAVLGHLVGGIRGKVCGLLEMPAGVRAAAYVLAVAALVTLAPGVGKTFIYIAF